MKNILALIVLLSFNVHAQNEPPPKQPAGGEKEVDEVITNNYLRALSGSKSRWSMSSLWNYNGGALLNGFGEDRPNIADASATTNKTDLDAVLNVKYALTSRHAIYAGFGMRWIAPFKSGSIGNYPEPRVDAVNPQLMYQYVYGIGPVQSVLQVTAVQWTQQDVVAQGYAQNFTADDEFMYEIGHSGVTIALTTELFYSTFFSNDIDDQSSQAEYQAQAGPYIEYKINDTYNLRYVSNAWDYEHYRRSDTWWSRDTVLDSFGVGITASRNIFFYPYIQYTPSAIAFSRMTVAMQANISLF